jgi:excisionase family DNA binding protein
VNKRYERPEWVAQQLGVSKQAAYGLIRQNKVGGILRLGRRILIDVEKFQEWAEKATTSPAVA